jgi:hypothetical protein
MSDTKPNTPDNNTSTEAELDESYSDSDTAESPDNEEKELTKTLGSYENPKGTEDVDNLNVPDVSKFLEQLKQMKPSERQNMINMFTNLSKNTEGFGNHSFRSVSDGSRSSNRDRLRERLRHKLEMKKSQKAVQELKNKAQKALNDVNSKNNSNVQSVVSKEEDVMLEICKKMNNK